MSPPITVVIPNFNGGHLLARNLPSVIAAVEHYANDSEIIVVDDGSKDDSLAILRQSFPQIKVVQHQTNKGFSEAIYSGVTASRHELLFLLNSDVELNNDCLAPLVQYFDDNDSVFSVSPCIFSETGAIDRHSWNVRKFQWGSLKAIPWTLENARKQRASKKLKTLYSSGGSMLVSKPRFLALGGFHPLYKPFYSEDVDLGLRAWRRGWSSYFEPNSTVIHQKQGSIKENVKRNHIKRIRRRNSYLLEWVHWPLWRIFTMAVPLSIWQLLGELILLDMVNVGGFFLAIPKIPAAIKARKELASSARFSFDEVIDSVG